MSKSRSKIPALLAATLTLGGTGTVQYLDAAGTKCVVSPGEKLDGVPEGVLTELHALGLVVGAEAEHGPVEDDTAPADPPPEPPAE